ncbi:MAG: ABC transporter ATP-binding protein [Proteobacteria bacterium]|nr:ABC transporter ATP-binding protein [Pseudomonadota bacterium]
MLGIWSKLSPTALLLTGQVGLVGSAMVFWMLGWDGRDIAVTMALVILIASRLIPAINRITGNLGSLWSVYPYIRGIRELSTSLDRAEARWNKASGESDRPIPTDWSELTVRNLSLHYEVGGVPALDDVSMAIARGKSYGIVGRSGAGKSTLVDVLLGLIEPEAGEVAIDGVPLASFSLRSWRGRIGYVPQSPFMLDDSLRANVAFGCRPGEISDAKVHHCLEMANLDAFTRGLERGLDTMLGDRGTRLSGGERQRVAIARALYSEPDILVFDEATSALDSINEAEIQKAIDNLRGRMTLIIIAHRLTTIRNTDAVFFLEGGRLVDQGSYQDLCSRNSTFRRMAGEQAAVREVG